MKKRLLITGIIVLIGYTNCAKSGFQAVGVTAAGVTSSTGTGTGTTTTPVTTSNGNNVVPVTVGNCGNVNQPCVTVTICTPGTSSCQTIDKVLVDTGSYGLRLFHDLVTISTAAVVDSSNRQLAECTRYLDGTSQWGPVKRADIILGGDKASSVPIQILDSTFAGASVCTTDAGKGPETLAGASYNGIIGVGLFTSDCGSSCVTGTNNQNYYACSGSTCVGSTVPLANQVSNPIAYMPTDNNGIILDLPAVTATGSVATAGIMYLGIGTQTNNKPTGLVAYQADTSGNFNTAYNGKSLPDSFIDSGSNGLFFPGTTITQCSSGNWYCPTATTSFSATVASSTNSVSKVIPFQIANSSTLLADSNPNWVFNDLGAYMSGTAFDWGLPFFLGRKVVVQISGRASTLGTGPLWAF